LAESIHSTNQKQNPVPKKKISLKCPRHGVKKKQLNGKRLGMSIHSIKSMYTDFCGFLPPKCPSFSSSGRTSGPAQGYSRV
jgi:hypothetical protein